MKKNDRHQETYKNQGNIKKQEHTFNQKNIKHISLNIQQNIISVYAQRTRAHQDHKQFKTM